MALFLNFAYYFFMCMKIRKKLIFPLLALLLVAFAFYPYQKPQPIHYVERSTGQIKTEQVVDGTWLYWLYNNPLGELSLQALIKRKVVSEVYGWLMHTRWSAGEIAPFIKKYHIDMSRFQKQHYKSFNDFFIRKLKPGVQKIDTSSGVVISPADGKLLAYKDIGGQSFIVKGYRFNVKSFLQNDSLANVYKQGSLLLFRLSPTDYHRFNFPVSGTLSRLIKISGDYYSVSPIALRKRIKIFCENEREYQSISTTRFGNVIMAEIGATMVGSIIQTYKGNIAVKGAEKGYFQFGGSSIILLFQPGKIKIDADLLKNTRNHLETEIKMGERIGVLN